MERPTAPSANASHELISLAAAFSAGLLLGARTSHTSPARRLLTLAAVSLSALALAEPGTSAVRSAGIRKRAGQVRFSLLIPRPVEQVFALCADFENFPKIIPSVEQVIDHGDGRSHWRARTRTGSVIEWDAVTNKFVTNSVIGWRSVAGSPIRMQGLLRFRPDGEGTCVHIMLEYEALTSSLRDSIAALLAPSNSQRMEQEIRKLAGRMTIAPASITRQLPPVVSPAAEQSA